MDYISDNFVKKHLLRKWQITDQRRNFLYKAIIIPAVN